MTVTLSFTLGPTLVSDIISFWSSWSTSISATVGSLGVAITDTTGTSVTLAATPSNLTIGQTILIGSEAMNVTAISGAVLTVARGYGGTAAAAHSAGAAVSLLVDPSPYAFMVNRWIVPGAQSMVLQMGAKSATYSVGLVGGSAA